MNSVIRKSLLGILIKIHDWGQHLKSVPQAISAFTKPVDRTKHVNDMNLKAVGNCLYEVMTLTSPLGLHFHTTNKSRTFPKLWINHEVKHDDCRDKQTGKMSPLYCDEILNHSAKPLPCKAYFLEPMHVVITSVNRLIQSCHFSCMFQI